MELSELQRKKIEDLAGKFSLRLLIQFGSQATGQARPNSDFDIAYLSSRRLELMEEGELAITLSQILRKREREVDMAALRSAGPLLRKEVADTGIVLYERKPLDFFNFQLYAKRLYLEALPLFKMRNERVKRLVDDYESSLR